MSTTMLAKLKKTLDAFGVSNGTAPKDPDIPKEVKKSNTATDKFITEYKLAHEFFIIDHIASYMKKRRESLKSAIAASFADRINPGVGETYGVRLHDYSVSKKVNQPARQFKTEILQSELLKRKWAIKDIQDLIEACMKDNKPAETWSVSELFE